MEYVNQRGHRFYIFQGTTKTGKPKFFASKRPTSDKGIKVDVLPDDLEIFETPSNGAVVIRRRKPSRILPAERDLVDRLAAELSNCSDVKTIVDGDRIVIYTPDTDPDDITRLTQMFGFAGSAPVDWVTKNTTYSANMRFTIRDVERRTYTAERYCYRGSIDNWIPISGSGRLESLARNLVPHLGRESFYELC